jgi:SAM-dependent methyltransferase
MKVFVSPDADSMGKFTTIVHAFPHVWNGRVLDVGCRSGQFRDALPNGNVDYLGLDLSPPANVVGNLGAGLPFNKASSDTVVALDVLEHTDDIYKAFTELCRVARNHVIIALPNLYEVTFRARFLLGQPLCGKYGLPSNPPSDRHRWLFSFQEAMSFTHTMGKKCGFEVMREGCLIGPQRSLIGLRYLTGVFPNLLSPWYVALLRRTENELSEKTQLRQKRKQ